MPPATLLVKTFLRYLRVWGWKEVWITLQTRVERVRKGLSKKPNALQRLDELRASLQAGQSQALYGASSSKDYMPRSYQRTTTAVHLMNCHFVWSPRYRRKLLAGKIAERLGQLIYEKAGQLGCRVIQLRIMSDHVHLFIESNPSQEIPNDVDPYALSHGWEVCERYSKDPLVFKTVTVRFAAEFLVTTEKLMQNAGKLRVPTLLVVGGDDKLVDPEGSTEFARRVTLKDFEIKVHDGFCHELFNEVGKEKVFRDVDAWLKPRT